MLGVSHESQIVITAKHRREKTPEWWGGESGSELWDSHRADGASQGLTEEGKMNTGGKEPALQCSLSGPL